MISDRIVLAGTVGMLAIAVVVRSMWIGGAGDFWFNVGMIGVLVLVARAASMTLAELGLERSQVRAGLAWGGVAFFLITVALIGAALVPATADFFDDDRADIGFGALIVNVVLVIPIGTVLLEELAFRGVLFGLARRMWSTVRAVGVVAVLFGLWHVPTAWNTATGSSAARGAAVAGTVIATTVAGVGFCWLRLRSRSLVAPMLAHVATNSVTLVVAWTSA